MSIPDPDPDRNEYIADQLTPEQARQLLKRLNRHLPEDMRLTT